MSEIPEDILNVASTVYAGLNTNNYNADCSDYEKMQDIREIASALLSERMKHYDARWANKAVQDVKDSFSGALWDISAERQRQVDEEGWTEEHDDQHRNGEMARAAAAYCESAARPKLFARRPGAAFTVPMSWPVAWDRSWWKPTSSRRDLVKAGALIVAEIKRIDRLAASPTPTTEKDES